MDKKTINKLILVFIFNCYLVAVSGQNKGELLPLPKIDYKNAFLSGNISSKALGYLDSAGVEIRINNPFLREVIYKVQITKEGNFHMSIPVICECFGVFAPESDAVRTFFWLAPGKETKLNISLDENQKLIADCKQPIDFTSTEMSESINLTTKMLRAVEDKKAMKEYSFGKLVETVVESDKNSIKRINSSSLSEAGKQFSIYDMKLHYVRVLFGYYWHEFLAKKKISIEGNDSSSFLSYFNLNDPYYLYSYQYADAVDMILSDSVLQIPPIGEQSATQWLKGVKASMRNLLGFDNGLFYDVLVANAYKKCLLYRHPFTEIQKKNIAAYFANNAYTQFLFAENESLLALLKRDSVKKIVVNDIPKVPKEKMLNEIVKKYSGKVVFVDFWATWCGPCLHSFNESEPAKEELKGLDVVYVYITNMSSPKDKWEAKIQGLEGEHYRLDGQSWECIMEQLNFSGIPSYVIYDKEGVLKHKQTTFMGKEKMMEWIKELL